MLVEIIPADAYRYSKLNC